ncbi:MAG TPA: 1-(5-phosphoribosyl)-5-[(5-phosphoribosylamino)methylideneamino]imidazole-4-carboxamide isomerase [Nitrospirales bacterium]|nr:1-(5-phosphoribosyl)-5-[(5-phosphoribosylamino)methylideneamino]imidazole-4-carboxamide isomerase [Nitrospirales bacterium]
MIVIPAIDLKDGRCVRLRQGRLQDETVYSQEPAEVARRWEDEGAQLLHVVDLNGAVEGTPRNRTAIEAILKAVTVPIQVGGGIRTLETMEAYLSSGIERVVLGTAVVRDRALLEEACRRFPGRVIVGVDAKDGKVAVEGWTDVADHDATDFAVRLSGLAIYAVIYTDIARDGMLEGPNMDGLRRMTAVCPVPVIASGGITRTDDLRSLRALGPKVIGAIVGKALYEGMLDLRTAMAAAN